MGIRVRAVILVLAWTMLLAWPVAAQEQGGSIQGVARDTSGGVLPGVTIEVRSAAGAVGTTVTNTEGTYRFPALPPGTYTITATLQGFRTEKFENTVLTLGQLLTINMTLQVAGVAETIEVTGQSPLIDVKQNATYTAVLSDIIDRIPKGRDFTGVLAVAPGANNEARAGGIAVDGASGAENRFIVDGIDTTSMQNGSSGKTFVTDFIQEVQVKTSGYNAEYPGATGGVVNALTKSGTNSFHASAGFYYSNNGATGLGNKDKGTFWVGKQRPALRLNPKNTRVAEYVTYPLDDIPVWEPVFDAGGPVLKDRLWYYVGYAPVRTSLTRAVVWGTPAPNGPAAQTFVQDNPVDRLTVNGTWQASNSVRLKFTYAPTWTKSRGGLPNIQPDGTSTSDATIDYASTGNNGWNNSYSGVMDWVARPSFYVNVMGGYFMYDSETLGNGTTIQHSMSGNITAFPNVPADLVQPDGYVDAKSSYKQVTNKQSRTYLNATGTWFKSWKGQHSIKGGARFERIANTRDIGQIQPTITFYWDQTYTNAAGVATRGPYGYYAVSRSVLGIGDIHSDNWGLFIQDGWSVNSRLTINAGVRAESELVPFYTPAERAASSGSLGDGIKFGFGDKLAPRIGFAYDIKGDGKWKTYGSFGRYYDIMKLELPSGSLGGEQWLIYNYTLDTLDWKSVNCQENDPSCPGTFLERQQLRFGSNEPNNPDTTAATEKYFGQARNLLQDNMKPMTSNEFTLGLDHELNSTTSVGARYVHKWVSHAIEDFGWNENGTEFYFIGNPGEGYIGELQFLWGQKNPDTGFTPEPLYNPANTGGKAYPQVKPVRKYDAIEFSARKRLANNWSAAAVYQYSRLWGNYPGLASSDEAGTGNARLSPNVNRLYDGPWMMYDTNGNQMLGRLNTDRPHYLKVQGTYDFKWGTSVGLNWYIRSGALFSSYINYQGYAWVFYKGRGDLGRTPVEQAADLLVQQEFRLGKRARLNVNLNISNLFDNDESISIYDSQFRDRITLTPPELFFAGFDPVSYVAGHTQRPDPRFYGGVTPARTVEALSQAKPLDRIFLPRRQIRIGARFSF